MVPKKTVLKQCRRRGFFCFLIVGDWIDCSKAWCVVCWCVPLHSAIADDAAAPASPPLASAAAVVAGAPPAPSPAPAPPAAPAAPACCCCSSPALAPVRDGVRFGGISAAVTLPSVTEVARNTCFAVTQLDRLSSVTLREQHTRGAFADESDAARLQRAFANA